jgi:hypothetical protein
MVRIGDDHRVAPGATHLTLQSRYATVTESLR